MKLLMKKHSKIILTILLSKYDKICHLHANKAAKLLEASERKGSPLICNSPLYESTITDLTHDIG